MGCISNTITCKSVIGAKSMDTKQALIGKIKNLLLVEDINLDFLKKLEEDELKTLIAVIRDRIENQKQ
jgi:hypothetical protein